MEEVLSRATLNQSDKAALEKIIGKGPSGMTTEEIAIVRARRVYLNSVEREVFKNILGAKEVKADEVEKMAPSRVLEVGNPPKGTGKPPVEIVGSVSEMKPRAKKIK